MKNLFFLFLVAVTPLFFVACDDEDDDVDGHEHMDVDPQYQAQILQPNSDMKAVGETVHIHAEFESLAGEIIHHINVRIYEKGNESNEMYNAPDVKHVMSTEKVEHHADFELTEDMLHKDLILEAKVWGHEADTHEVIETVEFHVHDQ